MLCVWWNLALIALFGTGLMNRQRLELGRNAYDAFVTVPRMAPELAYRYFVNRESYYRAAPGGTGAVSPVRILYLADIRFPLERANGIQSMETCHALARRGHEVHMVVRPDTTRRRATRTCSTAFHESIG